MFIISFQIYPFRFPIIGCHDVQLSSKLLLSNIVKTNKKTKRNGRAGKECEEGGRGKGLERREKGSKFKLSDFLLSYERAAAPVRKQSLPPIFSTVHRTHCIIKIKQIFRRKSTACITVLRHTSCSTHKFSTLIFTRKPPFQEVTFSITDGDWLLSPGRLRAHAKLPGPFPSRAWHVS